MSTPLPILYSFRRCPYAMRARMGLFYAQIPCELREVDLKNKPPSLLELSPKGTVPVLSLQDGTIIEESLDILNWALAQNDPQGWGDLDKAQHTLTKDLIHANDADFKKALDRYKYPTRYPHEHEGDEKTFSRLNRDKVEAHLSRFNSLIAKTGFLVKDTLSKADIATFPFLRQFANVERAWFDSLPFPDLQQWLQERLDSSLFQSIMEKYAYWEEEVYETFPKRT